MRSFKYTVDADQSTELIGKRDSEKRNYGEYPWSYNAPKCNEVAIRMRGDEIGSQCDTIPHRRDNQIKRISEFIAHLMPSNIHCY